MNVIDKRDARGHLKAEPTAIPQTNAANALSAQVLAAYERANRKWLERVQLESNLWTDVSTRLMSARSAPEAMQVYRDWVAQRLQMAAEDGQQMAEESRKAVVTLTSSLSKNWVTPGK
jgi:hypothetical protein